MREIFGWGLNAEAGTERARQEDTDSFTVGLFNGVIKIIFTGSEISIEKLL